MIVRTVFGDKEIGNVRTLPHEHLWYISQYARMMSRNYVDRAQVVAKAVSELRRVKEEAGLGLFVDCTPLNLGRDVELMKEVSEKSGVDIVCSTGLYYQEEVPLYRMSAEEIADYLVEDIDNVHAGVIKTAVELPEISDYLKKVLLASAMAAQRTGLPIVLHTNAKNGNGVEAVRLLMDAGICPEMITVGHLSGTEDIPYIASFGKLGCYIGLDRLINNRDEAYIDAKVRTVLGLCEEGLFDRILLSHDEGVFPGIDPRAQIREKTRFDYAFTVIVPALVKAGLSPEEAEKLITENPLRALTGK